MRAKAQRRRRDRTQKERWNFPEAGAGMREERRLEAGTTRALSTQKAGRRWVCPGDDSGLPAS